MQLLQPAAYTQCRVSVVRTLTPTALTHGVVVLAGRAGAVACGQHGVVQLLAAVGGQHAAASGVELPGAAVGVNAHGDGLQLGDEEDVETKI